MMTFPGWAVWYLKIFLFSVVIVALLVPVVRLIAVKLDAVDHPSDIKIHKKSTARLGGVAIFFGFVFSLIIAGALSRQQWVVIIGGTFALIIGILDDVRSVPATLKLAVLFVVTLFLSLKGVTLHLVPNWVYGHFLLNFFLTLFWVVGVTSAFNAIDHMDGLACGLTFFASLAYLYVAIQNHQFGWGAMAIALMGSSVGFMFYNYPPASIFMGDAGSFFLGYCLAIMSVVGVWSTNPLKAVAVPVFILGLPIFDLMYVVVRRSLKGATRGIRQVVTFSAKDHFSHRLLDLGMTQKQALFFTYAVMLTLSMGAVAMRYVLKVEAILLFIQFVMTAFLIVILIEFAMKNKRASKRDSTDGLS